MTSRKTSAGLRGVLRGFADALGNIFRWLVAADDLIGIAGLALIALMCLFGILILLFTWLTG